MNSFRIPEITQPYLEYDMIQTYTELPEFPHSRARLLVAFLDKPDVQESLRELYVVVTSLVQVALDTHEMVSVSNEAKEKKTVRSRQLKVLAGDYFSSRFYYLLSHAGQVDMVRQLSAAICEVNRLKMTFYMLVKQLKLTADEYIQEKVKIRMQLFLSFTKIMDGVRHKLWPEILHGFTRCEVLMDEIAKCETPDDFHGSWGYWYILQSANKEEKKQLESADADEARLRPMLLKYNVKGQLYHMLEEQIQQVWDKIQKLDSDKLMQELYHIGEPFLRFVSQPKVREER